jgi:hypothetical protein
MSEIGVSHERADAQAAIRQRLDPVEPGQMSDVDEAIGLDHAAFHQVEKICAGREIDGAGLGCSGDRLGHAPWSDIIEPSHAALLRLAALRCCCASSTASVIPT